MLVGGHCTWLCGPSSLLLTGFRPTRDYQQSELGRVQPAVCKEGCCSTLNKLCMPLKVISNDPGCAKQPVTA
eukprot:6212513-Pleurochrysis_carterae.AAC.1